MASKRPSRKKAKPAKPHARKKAESRVLSPDEEWANHVQELVLGDCHPFQRAAVADPSRFKTLLVGRGGGKTTAIRADALIALTSIRRGKLLYFATTREHAEELLWEPLRATVEYYGLTDDFEFSDSKLRVRCKRTGAELRLYGMDKPREVEKHRGKAFDRVYVDEAATHDPELLAKLLDRILGPRLGERMGRIMLCGTPGHILAGPFYDFSRPGATNQDGSPKHRPWAQRHLPQFADWDGYSSHHWSLRSVVELPEAREKYIALVNLYAEALKVFKRNGWSEDHPIRLREYEGIWAADATGMVFRYRPHKDGKEWNQWDPFKGEQLEGIQALRAAIAALPTRTSTGLELKRSDWHFVDGADKGSTNPFALGVFAFAPKDVERHIWHVFSFERPGMYARVIADLLLGPEHNTDKPEGVFGETGWPDAAVYDSDQAQIDELANVYGVKFKKAEKNPAYKIGAIELVNGDFVDGRIHIIKDSTLEVQVRTLQWKEDEYGRVKENPAQANHSSDCLVYGRREIAHLFESGAVSDEASSGRAAAEYEDPQGLGPGIGTDSPPDEDSGLAADPVFHDAWG